MDSDWALVYLTAALVLVTLVAVIVAWSARNRARDAVREAQAANRAAELANDIASKSNDIALDASQYAKSVAADVAWDEAIAAVAAIQTFDAAGHEPIGDRIAQIRVRLMLLIDRLDWDGFDEWIARELQCINLLARDASVKGVAAGPEVRNPEVALRLNEDLLTWISKFTMNLRFVRKAGPRATELDYLTKEAKTMALSVASRNGWDPPPDSVPGLGLLNLEET